MKITFSGDIAVVESISGNLHIAPSLLSLYSQSDYNVACLEAPICTSSHSAITKIGPNLCQTESIYDILSLFTHVSLANNHSMDFGVEGLRDTITSLNNAQIRSFGAGENWEDTYKPMILTQGGVSVAIFGLAESQYGCMQYPCDSMGYAWILSSQNSRIIAECKKNVDFVIVFAHAGLEDYDIPLAEWRYVYRQYIDAGADLVVGGHPHVIQGKEEYHGKQIYYSLGNCFFNCSEFTSNKKNSTSLILECNVSKNGIVMQEHFYRFSNSSIEQADSMVGDNFAQQSCLLQENNWHIYWEKYIKLIFSEWNSYYKFLFSNPIVRRTNNASWIVRKYYQLGHMFSKQFYCPPIDANQFYHNINIDTHRFVITRACSESINKYLK